MNAKPLTCISVLLICILTGCSTYRNDLIDEKTSGVIDVMTFNIRNGHAKDGENHWTHRKETVVDVIKEYAADVLGLQESFFFQAEYIGNHLPQYGMYSVGRNDGKKAGESCAIYYLKDRFKLVDSGTFWFSETPDKPSTNWGNYHLRICSWVRLVNKSDGRGLYVYNLHLDHRSQNSRQKSAELLAKMVSERKIKNPYVIIGDFNMTKENPGMKYLLKDAVETPYPKLFSAWHSLNPDADIRTGHGFKGLTEGQAIDHILVEKKTTVLKANIDRRKINDRYPSDHYPVTARLKLY